MGGLRGRCRGGALLHGGVHRGRCRVDGALDRSSGILGGARGGILLGLGHGLFGGLAFFGFALTLFGESGLFARLALGGLSLSAASGRRAGCALAAFALLGALALTLELFARFGALSTGTLLSGAASTAGAALSGATLSGATLSGATLSGAAHAGDLHVHADVDAADLELEAESAASATLSGAALAASALTSTTLASSGATLTGASLTGTALASAVHEAVAAAS